MRRLFFIAFYLEIGAALMILPWSTFWDRNYFAQAVPLVGVVTGNDFFKGAVSGLGLINVAQGVLDLLSLLAARQQAPSMTRFSRDGE